MQEPVHPNQIAQAASTTTCLSHENKAQMGSNAKQRILDLDNAIENSIRRLGYVSVKEQQKIFIKIFRGMKWHENFTSWQKEALTCTILFTCNYKITSHAQ